MHWYFLMVFCPSVIATCEWTPLRMQSEQECRQALAELGKDRGYGQSTCARFQNQFEADRFARMMEERDKERSKKS